MLRSASAANVEEQYKPAAQRILGKFVQRTTSLRHSSTNRLDVLKEGKMAKFEVGDRDIDSSVSRPESEMKYAHSSSEDFTPTFANIKGYLRRSLSAKSFRISRSSDNGIFHRSKSKKEKYFAEKQEKNIFKKILHPSYYERSQVFKKIFVAKSQVEESDAFLASYSCAYQREILAQGRMYISQSMVCFYANIIGWETVLTIPMKEIKEITKQKAAYIFPNSIQIQTINGEKYFFASFYNREKSIQTLKIALERFKQGNKLTPEEVWELNNGEDKNQSKSSLNSPSDSTGTGELTSSMTGFNSKSRSDKDSCSQSSSNGSVEYTDECYQLDDNPTFSGETEVLDPKCDEPTNCPCEEHPGRLLLDAIFPVRIGQLYALLFTDNPWFHKLCAEIKHHGYAASPWTRDKQGEESRTCTYTIELNHAMAPKNCVSNERQVLTYFPRREDGIMVFKETQNSGVPYADNFVVQCRYCISRVTANSCRVKVHGGIHYKRTIWSIIKGYIEKGTNQGLDEHYQVLEKMLNEECLRINRIAPKDDFDTSSSPQFEVCNRRKNSAKSSDRLVAGGENEKLIVEKTETLIRKDFPRPTDSSNELRTILIGILAVLILYLLSNYLILYRLSDSVANSESGKNIEDLRAQLAEIRSQMDRLIREKSPN